MLLYINNELKMKANEILKNISKKIKDLNKMHKKHLNKNKIIYNFEISHKIIKLKTKNKNKLVNQKL